MGVPSYITTALLISTIDHHSPAVTGPGVAGRGQVIDRVGANVRKTSARNPRVSREKKGQRSRVQGESCGWGASDSRMILVLELGAASQGDAL